MSHDRPTKLLGRSPAMAVLIVAVLLSVPGVAGAQAPAAYPAPGVRQAADALWAVVPDGSGLSVCQNPTDAASITGCFGAGSPIPLAAATNPDVTPATDGTNAYFGTQPGYSCPIAGYGQNCTQIQVGWGRFNPTDVVAAGGYLWLSAVKYDGIYRCPSNLPYTAASSMPAGCVEFDDPGSGSIMSLAYANGRLYAGLSGGVLVSCDASRTGSCVTLDSLGTSVNALAVGGGYVWAGLGNGRIWRCDPGSANACDLWETAGQPVMSLADDGQGTLWAAASGGVFTHPSNVIWSCPEAYANGCATVISNVNAWWVTAGAGHGFSSVVNGSTYPPIAYGESQYPQSVALAAVKAAVNAPPVLYIPAGGVTGLGGLQVRLAAPKRPLARVCAERDSLPATVVVRGAHKVRVVRRLDLCGARDAARIGVRRYDLLYPGAYSIRIRSAVFSGTKRVVVAEDRTARITVGVQALKRSS